MSSQIDTQPIFRALADPSRRAMLELLAEGPRSVTALASGFEMTRPGVAKHLRILEEGGLITVIPQGRERINYLQTERLQLAQQWLAHFDRFWDEKLAQLKLVVEENND